MEPGDRFERDHGVGVDGRDRDKTVNSMIVSGAGMGIPGLAWFATYSPDA